MVQLIKIQVVFKKNIYIISEKVFSFKYHLYIYWLYHVISYWATIVRLMDSA